MKFFKKIFSFSWADIFGIILGILLLSFEERLGSFFDVLRSYWLYLFVFLAVFIFNLWTWFLNYHGEFAYLKGVMGHVIVDYIRIILAMISTISVYALFISFY